MPYGFRRRLDEAIAAGENQQANAIFVEEQPTADTITEDYVYLWIDPSTEELTVNSLDDSGSLVQITLNATVADGDTGLIGGLL